MSFIFLASPYTHSNPRIMLQRYEKARDAAAKLLRGGITVFSPIVHFHDIALLHDFPKDAAFWENHNRPFLQLSCGLYVLTLPGWEDSIGVRREIELAHSFNLEVLYLHEDF